MRQWTRVPSRKPFDSHFRFPRSLCRSCSYGHIPGFAAPARGNRRWTGATPPFCCPVRARGRCAIHICATPPGRVAPVAIIPGGKANNDTREVQGGTCEHPRHPRGTGGGPQEAGGGPAAKTTLQSLPELWLSRRLSELPPMRRILRVRTRAPVERSMSIERTCAGCRDYQVDPGEQHCDRCGDLTETLWRWMGRRPCTRCE